MDLDDTITNAHDEIAKGNILLDSGIVAAYVIDGISLGILFVNSDIVKDGILPLWFDHHIYGRTIVVEITPSEFQELNKILFLPDGWSVGRKIY